MLLDTYELNVAFMALSGQAKITCLTNAWSKLLILRKLKLLKMMLIPSAACVEISGRFIGDNSSVLALSAVSQ